MVADGDIALGDVIHQGLPLGVQFIIEHGAADGPGGVAADGGVQRFDAHLGAGQFADGIQGQGGVLLGGLVAGDEHAEDVGQGTHLGRLVVEGRGLDPGVLAVVLEAGVIGFGGFVIGMLGPIAFVPGVLDGLLDPFPEVVVMVGGDGLEALEIGVGDVAAGHIEGRALGVHGHVGHTRGSW